MSRPDGQCHRRQRTALRLRSSHRALDAVQSPHCIHWAPLLRKRFAAKAIDHASVSENAVAVVRGLRTAGFDAYLVGGCVRDLLLGATPKDFDVATSATPEQVRGVFPRVRLVGRRFRIAHVRMRREIIEVSTFRGASDDGNGGGRHVSEDGVLLRDNVHGTIDEDAFRRDFTINALYLDPEANKVLDYCQGRRDIKARQLRTIGDPAVRFREDPVRMLRAIRLAAKLDLALHPATEAAIAPTREMLSAIPPARLFDEFGKMFLGGHGVDTFEMLGQHGLTDLLFPTLNQGQTLAKLALASTDQRLAEDKPVTPGFLLAAFLWDAYLAHGGQRRGEREQAASAALAVQRETIAMPRRHSYFVRDVWRLQPWLEERRADTVPATLADPRFRAAYDFLLLRVEAEEVPAALGDWWTQAQTVPLEEALRDLPAEQPPRRRRGRGRRRRRTSRADATATAVLQPSA